ncbi:hypothetical protein [Pandoravirus japonicus]|uniref:Uncharacterized protein n=1 Tax=Pandoravirus japonicus TaxID=2823154 RepID=A0A811BML0_9VIRU|nr:hypothetical protein [Pandoravirus japonicus]
MCRPPSVVGSLINTIQPKWCPITLFSYCFYMEINYFFVYRPDTVKTRVASAPSKSRCHCCCLTHSHQNRLGWPHRRR